jgi:DNA-3-methyladenine glycosylase
LIRAIEPAVTVDWMQRNRPVSAARDLTSGPSKLCLALDIEREFDGADLCTLKSDLIIAENPDVKRFVRQRGEITTATRIGLSVAAHTCRCGFTWRAVNSSRSARGIPLKRRRAAG